MGAQSADSKQQRRGAAGPGRRRQGGGCWGGGLVQQAERGQRSKTTQRLMLLWWWLWSLLVWSAFGGAVESEVVVHLDSRSKKRDSFDRSGSVKIISFCVDCPSPAEEGSIIYGLVSKHLVDRPDHAWLVTSSIVYSVPNLADRDKLINPEQLFGRIALVDRGKVPLHEKIRRMQNAGATAVIIADDGQCDELFLSCGPRAGSVREGGFAAHDDAETWSSLTIPAYLITKSTADRLRNHMSLTQENVRGLGVQFFSSRNSLISSKPAPRREL